MPDRGKRFRRALTNAVALPFVLMACLALFLLWQIDRMAAAARWVDHSDQVTAQANGTLKLLVDLESGFRGYQLTGNSEFLKPYLDAEPRILPQLAELSHLVSDNPLQVQRVQQITQLYGEWHSFTRRVLRNQPAGAPFTSTSLEAAENKPRMDAIRKQFTDFINLEDRLRAQRARYAQHAARIAIISGGFLILGLGTILALFVRRELLAVSRSYESALETTRRQAEELQADQKAISENRQRLAGIIESAMDAIISVDERQVIQLFNRAAEQIFRCPASEAIGRPLDRFIPERYREKHQRDVRDFGRTGVTTRDMYSPGQLVGLRADGEEFPIEASISQISIEGQKLYTIILRDITERRRTEEALRSTEKLAATGRLAASIAHEINNPMASVTNLLYLLQSDRKLPNHARELVGLAQDEVARMSTIVRQMLGLHRESAHPMPVDVVSVVREVVQLYDYRARKQGVTVTTDLDDSAAVVGFPGELRQVVANLLINAVEAVPVGGHVLLRVHPGREFTNSNRTGVRVIVADDGPGIPPEARRQIFEPFFTTKGERGTGLGLWITSGIVAKHGGYLRFRSRTTPGCSGTVFSIFLPHDRRRLERKPSAA